jgi:hypothetical protein
MDCADVVLHPVILLPDLSLVYFYRPGVGRIHLRRLGLDPVSYIEDPCEALQVADQLDLARLSRLSDNERNALNCLSDWSTPTAKITGDRGSSNIGDPCHRNRAGRNPDGRIRPIDSWQTTFPLFVPPPFRWL